MLLFALILLWLSLTFGIWKLMGRTALTGWLKAVLTLLLSALTALLLYWGALWLSILLFQMRDAVGW